MKLRITGTSTEALAFVDELNKHFAIISVSRFYPNNRNCLYSEEGRLYIELSSIETRLISKEISNEEN